MEIIRTAIHWGFSLFLYHIYGQQDPFSCSTDRIIIMKKVQNKILTLQSVLAPVPSRESQARLPTLTHRPSLNKKNALKPKRIRVRNTIILLTISTCVSCKDFY